MRLPGAVCIPVCRMERPAYGSEKKPYPGAQPGPGIPTEDLGRNRRIASRAGLVLITASVSPRRRVHERSKVEAIPLDLLLVRGAPGTDPPAPRILPRVRHHLGAVHRDRLRH